MRSRADVIAQLTHPGLVAVIRTQKTDQVAPVCQALLEGGLHALEITLTVPNALQAIREVGQSLGRDALIGAGTVLNAASCREALQAGAEFIVSPITRADIVETAHAADRPVMLGAYTPTEAQTAYELGADFIKLFPADKLGPSFVKALLAPLPHLRIVPTGGVDLNSAADFLKAGCAALGVGSSLLTKDILATANWAELTRLAKAYVEIVHKARSAAS